MLQTFHLDHNLISVNKKIKRFCNNSEQCIHRIIRRTYEVKTLVISHYNKHAVYLHQEHRHKNRVTPKINGHAIESGNCEHTLQSKILKTGKVNHIHVCTKPCMASSFTSKQRQKARVTVSIQRHQYTETPQDEQRRERTPSPSMTNRLFTIHSLKFERAPIINMAQMGRAISHHSAHL